MRVCRTVADVRDARAALPTPVGLVPTMGALHAGHTSLVERSVADCASTIVSIYVNPLQFGPSEDLARYPRPFDDDITILERAGVDVVFAPADREMYPSEDHAWVEPGDVARALEGERRPGHFRGVATVVLKLLHIVAPKRAYFGRKDAQQLAVVTRMVADLDLAVEIVACPTVREKDGLALSSRNRYLSDEERRDATGLYRALRFIADAGAGGAVDLAAIVRGAQAEMRTMKLDYLAVVEPRAFVPLSTLPRGTALVAVGAGYCGATRLIDNVDFVTP